MEDISQNFPVVDQENEEQQKPTRRRPFIGVLFGFVRNLLVFVVLIGVIVGSFWVSFELGKKILFPAKNVKSKIQVAVPEPPPSIMALQELEKIMSEGTGKGKKGKSALPKVPKASAQAAKIAQKAAVEIPKMELPLPPVSTTVRAVKPKIVKKAAKVQKRSGNGFFKVQAGLFVEKDRAKELAAQINVAGYSTYLKKLDSGWRVQVGAYRNKSEAETLKNALEGKGIKSVVLFE